MVDRPRKLLMLVANDCRNGVEVRLAIMLHTETTSVYVLYIINKPAVNGGTLCKEPIRIRQNITYISIQGNS
jgi:hypothetical protein